MRSALGWGTIMRLMPLSRILLSSFVFALVFVLQPTQVFALDACPGTVTGVGLTLPRYYSGMTHTIDFDITNFNTSYEYYFKVKGSRTEWPYVYADDEAQTDSFYLQNGLSGSNAGTSWQVNGNTLRLIISDQEALKSAFGNNADDHYVLVERHQGGYMPWQWQSNQYCLAGEYKTITSDLTGCGKFLVWQDRYSGPKDCSAASSRNCNRCFQSSDSDCLETGSTVFIQVSGLTTSEGPYSGDATAVMAGVTSNVSTTVVNGVGTFQFPVDSTGTYTVSIYDKVAGVNAPFPNCSRQITLSASCPRANQCSANDSGLNPNDPAESVPFSLCSQVDRTTPAYTACVSCVGATQDVNGTTVENQAGVWTAIGCIKRDPTSIIQRFVRLGLGIGGGVSLIMTLAGGFILTPSQGDPKRTGQAKEMITNAVIGLIFVIFSVMILQFVGFTVLKIPGFGIK